MSEATEVPRKNRRPKRKLVIAFFLMCFAAVAIALLINTGVRAKRQNIEAHGHTYGHECVVFASKVQKNHAEMYRAEFLEWFKGQYAKTQLHPSSVLMLACDLGEEQLVRWLIGEGADVNFVSESCDTPLILAIQTGSLECVKTLLREGADPNMELTCGSSSPFLLSSSNPEIHSLMTALGARLNHAELSEIARSERERDERRRAENLIPDDLSTEGQVFQVYQPALVYREPKPLQTGMQSYFLLPAMSSFTSRGTRTFYGDEMWIKAQVYNGTEITEGWINSDEIEIVKIQ